MPLPRAIRNGHGGLWVNPLSRSRGILGLGLGRDNDRNRGSRHLFFAMLMTVSASQIWPITSRRRLPGMREILAKARRLTSELFRQHVKNSGQAVPTYHRREPRSLPLTSTDRALH